MWLKRIGVVLLCGLFSFTTAGCFARGSASARSGGTVANLIILGAGVAMATAAAASDGADCGESSHPSGPCIDGTKFLMVPAVPLLLGGSLGLLYTRTGSAGSASAGKPRAPRRGLQTRARTLPGLTPSR